MKAVYITRQGPPDVLTYGDLPDPTPGQGEVVARVRACALNRRDLFARAGTRGMRKDINEPFILGSDVAADVVSVGDGVTNVRPGDRVLFHVRWGCGACSYCREGRDNICPNRSEPGVNVNGGYAELMKAPAQHAYPFPSSMSYEEAASIPLTSITAWHMLVTKCQLKPGDTALILGASGGVGSMAIQMAKLLHARVLATASNDEKARRVKEFGADHVINYSQGGFADKVKELTDGEGADVVFDSIGAEVWEQAFASMRIGGRFVTCGVTAGYKAELHLGMLFTKELSVMGVTEGPASEFQTVMKLVNMGKIKGRVGIAFPLAQARQAHELMEGRNFTGKIVLTV